MIYLRRLLVLFFLLAALGAGILFALQNTQQVPLDLLVYTFQPHSLALWLLLAFALGGVTGMLVSSLLLLRARVALRGARRQLVQATAEVDRLEGAEHKTVG